MENDSVDCFAVVTLAKALRKRRKQDKAQFCLYTDDANIAIIFCGKVGP